MDKPNAIRTEVFERGSCLFFDDLHTMMISLSLVFITGDLFVRKRSPILEIDDTAKLEKLIEIPFQGMTIKEDYSFQAYRPVKSLYENIVVNKIEFKVYPPLGMSLKGVSGITYIDQPTLFNQKLISAAFVNFFESNRAKMESKFSTNTSAWPSDLNFGRVIRNAYRMGVRFISRIRLPHLFPGRH